MRQRLRREQKTYFHPFYFPSVNYVPLAAQLEFHCCIYLFKGSNQLEFATQCGPKNVSNRKSTDLNRYIKKQGNISNSVNTLGNKDRTLVLFNFH